MRFSTLILIIFVFKTVKGIPLIIEKGQSAKLECKVLASVSTEVTWQLNELVPAIISTCNILTNQCNDAMPAFYQGAVTNDGVNKLTTLTITSARRDETRFVCMANNEVKNTTELEVYAWPSKPKCTQIYTVNHMAVNCSTANFYPQLDAIFYMEGVDFSDHADAFAASRYGNELGSGTEGDYSGWIMFNVSMYILLPKRKYYVEMISVVSNMSSIAKKPASSDPSDTLLSVPEVEITNCPVGPGVTLAGIRNGTQATCNCELTSRGFPNGFARWIKDHKVVGEESVSGLSSIVTISYNSSDLVQKYECWPMSILIKAEVKYYYFIAHFYSAASSNDVTKLFPIATFVAVSLSGISSRYFSF